MNLAFDLWIVSLVIFFFFLAYTLTTLFLTGLSLVEETQQKLERGELFRHLRRPLRPGISVVAPAHNEQLVIVSSVRSLLASDYEPLEVLIVDDGSTDKTLEALNEAFANGGAIEDGVMVHPRVPVSETQASQVGEYLRAFLGARIAWAGMNGLLIISGAFGVFRRDLFRAVGGLARETLGEDMELVLRMHEQFRPVKPGARIEFAADATSWTEAPAGLSPLCGQRVRWHIGLLDNMRLHRRMIGRPRYGTVGLRSLPHTILFEVVAPILQVAGYAILIVLVIQDEIAWQYTVALFVVVLLFGQLQTAGAILIDEIGFGRCRRRDLTLIGGWGLLEIFWYRPLTALWRAWASILWLVGRRPGWGRSRAVRRSRGRLRKSPSTPSQRRSPARKRCPPGAGSGGRGRGCPAARSSRPGRLRASGPTPAGTRGWTADAAARGPGPEGP